MVKKWASTSFCLTSGSGDIKIAETQIPTPFWNISNSYNF